MAFSPLYDKETISKYAGLYQQNPAAFTQQQAEMLRDHAESYDVSFALTDEHHQSSIMSLLKQAGVGYLEGFTTVQQTDNRPGDEWERLSRRIGNLLGFIGVMPPVGPLKRLSGKSLPMMIGDKATDYVGKRVGDAVKAAGGGEHATSAAMRFLTGEKAAGIAHGAFKLGVASGVSSWQGGVDQMLEGFVGGASMGAIFRGIATLNNTGNEPARKFINALAGSLYTGLDSTLQGQTTPEQIYSYLEGAFFSWNEPRADQFAASRFMQKASAKINQTAAGERKLYEDPEQHEGWHDLSFEARNIVKDAFMSHYAPIDWVIKQGIEKGLWSPEKADAVREELERFDPIVYKNHERDLEQAERDELLDIARQEHRDTNPDSEFSGGIIPEDLKISKSVEGLVDRVLMDVIPENKRVKAKVDLTTEEARLIAEKPDQAAEQYIKFIEKYAGTTLSDERVRGQIRQRVNQRINQYDVSHLTVDFGGNKQDGDYGETWPDRVNIVNNGRVGPSGEVLRATIDKPRIADAYEQAARRMGVEPTKEVVAILDHVWSRTGGKIELDKLDQHVDDWARQFDWDERPWRKQDRINGLFSKIHDFARSMGYYYQGGRGDAGRLYMVKWHPEMPDDPVQARAMLSEFGKMMRDLNDADPNHKAGWTAENIANEARARKEFIDQHPGLKDADVYYDHATLSNILYNLEMNGFNGWADRGKITAGDFINNPKAFNKRQQIWLTAGWKLDPGYEGYKAVGDLVNGNRIKVRYRPDWTGPIGPEATKYVEATDGALIMRRDILLAMLRDMGVPTDGMIGKSFIVEPDSELGGLLGKYAMHLADPETEAMMQREGLHAIIYKSAAKQLGRRLMDGKDEFTVGIDSFKGVPSEIVDKHSIAKQRVAKQLLTNLTEFSHSPINKAVIRDMIDSITRRGLLGTTEGNAAVVKTRLALQEGKELTDGDVEAFTKNIDDIGIDDLFNMVRHANGKRLADAFYRHVLRMETEDVRLAKEDGEASDGEVAEADNTLADYESIFQRLTDNAPKGGVAIWQHKWVRPYVEKAVLNYVVRRTVRPHIENSGTFRLGPYTNEMAAHPATERLQNNRNIFMLHDKNRELELKSSLFAKGKMKLGDIIDHLEWNDAESKWDAAKGDPTFATHIDQINELIRGVVVRVPMGSISGAHVLRFGGFTGIDGYGGVTHPETTRAIGGADLDGDKAFYFFGDESHGFKPGWKDMYAANRDEFLVQGTPGQRVEKIISGGQTGADMGGLLAGRELGVATGGTAPPRWMTEDGSQPDRLRALGLVEGGPDPKTYPLRTMKNVDDSDGTIAFVVGKSVGTRNTIGYAQTGQWRFGFGSKDDGRKPVLEMKSLEFTPENVNMIADFIRRNGIRALNVAGHREKSVPGIEQAVAKLVKAGVEKAGESSSGAAQPGENIASTYNRKDPGSLLGQKLTNVTRDKSMEISDVPGLRRPTRQHRGGTFLSAENWYLENQVGRGPTRENMAIMQRIIEQKFIEHPELVDEITAKGGSAWLDQSRHVVLGGPWEGTGIDSPFLSVLNSAYLARGGVERPSGGTGQAQARNHVMKYKMPASQNITGRDTSTIELIENGTRTATTRSYKLGDVGDVVTFEGRPQRYRITKVEQLTRENVTDQSWVDEWSRKEGWTTDYFKSILNKTSTVKIGSWQTTFEKFDGADVPTGGTGHIPDLKNLHRPELATSNETHKAFMDNPASLYSPHVRMLTSQAAYMGRASLKNAVTSRSIALSAHSTLVGMGGRYSLGEAKVGKDIVELYVEARTGPAIMRKFQEFSRAAIELTADPMDEPGLKPGSEITRMIYSKLFKWVDQNGNEVDPSKIRPVEKGGENPTLNFHNFFSDVNSALYSRNYKEGRRWIYEEIQGVLGNMNRMLTGHEEAANTLFPILARKLEGLDWRDGMLQRLKTDDTERMVGWLAEARKTKRFGYLAKLLERGSLVPSMDSVVRYMKMGLHTDEGWRRELDETKYTKDLVKKLKAEKGWNESEIVPGARRWQQRRASFLAEQRAKFEDYVTNDLADMVTVRKIDAYAKLREAESKDTWEQEVRLTSEAVNRIRAKLTEEMERFRKQQRDEIANTGQKLSSTVRKLNMDKVIAHYRETLALQISGGKSVHLPQTIRDLFDHMILGSFDYGTKRFENQKAKIMAEGGMWSSRMNEIGYDIKGPDRFIGVDEALALVTEKERVVGRENISEVQSTRYLRYGFDSNLVSNKALREHLADWSSLFDYRIGKQTMREINENAAKAEKNIRVSQIVYDKDGNRTKVNLLDLAELDPVERKMRDTIKPFEVRDDAQETPELVSEFNKLRGHMEHYPTIGPRIHLVVRELFNKDFNAMNISELKSLNRFFEQTRKGSLYSQMTKLMGQKENLGLKRWYWHVFPEAINRDTMRNFLFAARKQGIFIDKDGTKVIGQTMVPTGPIGVLHKLLAYIEDMKTRTTERENNSFNDKIYGFLHGLEDGPSLFKYAVARAEFEGATSYGAKDGEIKVLRERMEEELAHVNSLGLLNKVYTISKETMTGDQLARKTQDIVKVEMDRRHKWIVGDDEFLLHFFKKDKDGLVEYHKIAEISLEPGKSEVLYGEKSDMPKMDMNKLIDYFISKADAGEPIPLEFGLENLELVKRSILAKELIDAGQISAYNKLITRELHKTGKREGYWPHIRFSNPQKVVDAYAKRVEEILNRVPADKKEEAANLRELREITMALQQLKPGVMVELPSQALYDKFDQMMQDTQGFPTRDAIKWEEADHSVQMMKQRKMHLEGWEISPDVLDLYTSRIVDAFYRSVGEIHARQMIKHFELEQMNIMPEKLAKSWTKFYKSYVNNALGYPAILPDGYADDPDMKVRYTPYEWFNDLNTKRMLNSVVKKLGLDKSTDPHIKKLKGYEPVDYKTVMWLANLEARYEMAALLAHPKTAVANLLGGTTNTVINAGFRNTLKANDIKYLRMINPEWRSMDDVDRSVREWGVIEEYLLKEAQYNPAYRSDKHKQFMKDLEATLKKDPNANDATLRALASRHGVWNEIFEKSAWFMRVTERKLRRDSFMAHYIQIKEKWGDAMPYDHPILIQMAKKGVQATQFMYSNTFRPMFAQTAMGKVLTRFQSYAWNSVKLRNDILREAKWRGYEEGTVEFDRFKRLAVIDMVSFALASAFMYSIFDNNLPQPYSWMQDWANWIFGDDEEKEKAFFGSYPTAIAPLQMITPPALRIVGPTIDWMITGNGERLADYHVWMMFPFGRIGKDLLGKNNVFENPHRLLEKTTGFPLYDLGKSMKAYQGEGDPQSMFEHHTLTPGHWFEASQEDEEKDEKKKK